MNESTQPLVSIGVPVRNGGAMISGALDRLVCQTYRNLEIVISDNHSSDETEDVCRKFADQDERITYHRQPSSINALDNFRYLFEHTQSEYFMWAAHDDRWSLNYVEVLLGRLMKAPSASIAFSDVAMFHDPLRWEEAEPAPYDVELDPTQSYWRRLIRREYIRSGYLHIYGLIRRRALSGYDWPANEIGADRPLLFHLSCRGPFVSAPGAVFYCYKPLKRKTKKQRSLDNFARPIGSFPYVRLSWSCAKSGVLAEKLEGRPRNVYAAFVVFLSREIKKKTLVFTRSILRGLKRLVGVTP